MKKWNAGLLLAAFLLTSCAPTYSKDRVVEGVVSLCKRDYGLQVKAQLVQTTLGVLVSIPGLMDELMEGAVSSGGMPIPAPVKVEGQYEKERFNFQFLTLGSLTRAPKADPDDSGRPSERKHPALDKLGQVHQVLFRVASSTDAVVEFYTVIARDPAAGFDIIYSGHINDIKQAQFWAISQGELQRRSRAGVRFQPELLARQTVKEFLQDLVARPLPQLLSRYAAPTKRFGELLPKILDCAVDIQGREKVLSESEWPARQIGENEAIVYVPLSPIHKPGAYLFTVLLTEKQGFLLDLEKLETPILPSRYREFGPPQEWGKSFYLQPISLPIFLTDQITKRVLSEFRPIEPESKSKKGKKEEQKPVSNEEVTRVVMETSAYVLHSYQFTNFEGLTVTDTSKGTRWQISSKDLDLYRQGNPPPLKPAP